MHIEYWWARKKETTRKELMYVVRWILERQDGLVWIGLI
jgi:hypothetical protein